MTLNLNDSQIRDLNADISRLRTENEDLRKRSEEAWEERDQYLHSNVKLKDEILSLRKRVAELDGQNQRMFNENCTLGNALLTERARAEQAEAQLAEAKEREHYANGVADLAMKHRNEAEAQLAIAREALEKIAGCRGWHSARIAECARAALAQTSLIYTAGTGSACGIGVLEEQLHILSLHSDEEAKGHSEAIARAEQAEKRVAELEDRGPGFGASA